jgi:hypothetical protein
MLCLGSVNINRLLGLLPRLPNGGYCHGQVLGICDLSSRIFNRCSIRVGIYGCYTCSCQLSADRLLTSAPKLFAISKYQEVG